MVLWTIESYCSNFWPYDEFLNISEIWIGDGILFLLLNFLKGFARITRIKSLLTAQFRKRSPMLILMLSWKYQMHLERKMSVIYARLLLSKCGISQEVVNYHTRIGAVAFFLSLSWELEVCLSTFCSRLVTKQSCLTVSEQSPWTLIKSNLFLHRRRKNQSIDEVET